MKRVFVFLVILSLAVAGIFINQSQVEAEEGAKLPKILMFTQPT